MEFNPHNPIVQRCLQGMVLEDEGNPDEAIRLFLQAWNEATHDFEKYLAAFYLARCQKKVTNQLKWLETSLQLALHLNNDAVQGALSPLYSNIAECYAALGDLGKAKKNRALALSAKNKLSDKGPFYHGTKVNLQIGDLLTAGGRSNYKPELLMNHIYFTAVVNGAGLAAALAKGEGHPRVYIVEPTGSFENDPNVTNKKFPGNPTRSYRSREPLKIVGEVSDWERQTPEQLKAWKEKLVHSKGNIIN